ncbi:MAG: efflux RND transporter periplasmic adaptor subunit [Nitrospirae bacterium]|nr:efflux RND transporter periplasmic adaptor subunit [Nitrospirota bacterium]
MANEDIAKLKIDKSRTAPGPRRRRNVFRWVAAAVVVVTAVVLFFAGVFTPAVEVEVATVSQMYPSQAFTLLNASGYVVAERKAAVASKITSRLVALNVEEGSHVKKGEVIARLEGDDVVAARDQAAANLRVARSSLDQARAELHDATLSYNRNKDLVGKGYIARADFDSADARHEKALASVKAAEAAIKGSAAALRNAEVQVEYTLIRAPFDAVVLTKNADVGDIVTPLGAAANAKASVVTIADMGSLQVEVDVAESNIEQVKTGQPCEIALDALPETRFPGVVHMVVPTADRSKATVLVKVRFLSSDSRVLPEMSAKVAFLQRPVKAGEEKPRTALNPSAIVTRNGGKKVFLVKDDRAVETAVTLGPPIGGMVQVTAGLKPGDRVALKPLDKLRNGDRVKAAEK